MNLRTLTPSGIEKFGEYLDFLESEPKRLVPTHLLDADEFSQEVNPPINVEQKTFGNRYAAAEYLDGLLSEGGMTDIDRNVGLWAWLSLFYFDQLCPLDKSGDREPRERPAYLPEPNNFQRYYRHLLLGPFLIFRAHRDDPKRAMAFLCKPLPIIDDVVAQLAARQEFVTNRALMELATKLYFDPSAGTLKRGAGGKGNGSPRRLADILWQFDLTWDLYSVTLGEFPIILPKEFERFLPAPLAS